jgi:cell pole-organizing protein PopZ
MAHFFPVSIMNMFAPRPPLEFKPPLDAHKKPLPPYSGVADVLARIRENKTEVPPSVVQPTKQEAKEKKKSKKQAEFQEKRKRQIAKCQQPRARPGLQPHLTVQFLLR